MLRIWCSTLFGSVIFIILVYVFETAILGYEHGFLHYLICFCIFFIVITILFRKLNRNDK